MSKERLYDPPLMPHLLVEGLNRYNDEPCLFLGDKVASYREVRQSTSQMVQALQAKGLGKGSRVAVISANRPEVLSNIAAMQLTGCVGTPLHPLGSLDDHAYVLKAAGIDALVYDASVFDEHAAQLKARVPGLQHLLGFGPTKTGEDYLALAAGFEPQALVAPDVLPDDVSSVNFTGGTTGKPKGVMSTHRVTAYMTQIQMAEWEFPQEVRMLMATPLSHAAAAFFIPVLQKGGAFYVMQGFSPDEFFNMVEKHRITCTMLVPVMLYYLLDSPRRATRGYVQHGDHFLRRLRHEPGPTAPGHRALGPGLLPVLRPVRGAHGGGQYAPGRPRPAASPGASPPAAGPRPGCTLPCSMPPATRCRPDEPGEICVRGPLVMKGYKDMPEQTAEAFAGGWLHTGDVGKLDEEGFLYIVDRTKDMIVTGGFNVFPREVEDVLAGHEAVGQVAVVGVPDEQWGEAVKAVIVLRPGIEQTAELVQDLQALVKQAKGSVQAPKSIDFVDAIPLTPVGKPDKKALRARYWQDRDRGVG